MVHHHVSQSKPWPILPSYLPWTPQTQPHLKSCEGYFGNGFNHLTDVIPRPRLVVATSSSGRFRCYFSGTLGSSVCEAGWVRIDPCWILMSRGAEFIGRLDDDELPVFEPSLFRVQVNWVLGSDRSVYEEFLERYLHEAEILRHTVRELVGSVEFVAPSGSSSQH